MNAVIEQTGDRVLAVKTGLTNREIVERWLAGKPGMGRALRSNGIAIWSYMVMVARIVNPRMIEIAPEMCRFWSITTSRHLNLVKAAARHKGFSVIEPQETEGGGSEELKGR